MAGHVVGPNEVGIVFLPQSFKTIGAIFSFEEIMRSVITQAQEIRLELHRR